MNPRRVGAVMLRQLYLYMGSPQRVLPLFIWVTLDVVLWGFITRFLGQVSHSTFGFVPGLLSSGEQTRVGLAKAMLNAPHLLLLDEPTASIDPSSARDIRAHIEAFAASGDRGVVWTSHNMYEVEAVCDRILFLSRGKVVLEGDPKTLPKQHGAASLDDLFVEVAHEALDAHPP